MGQIRPIWVQILPDWAGARALKPLRVVARAPREPWSKSRSKLTGFSTTMVEKPVFTTENGTESVPLRGNFSPLGAARPPKTLARAIARQDVPARGRLGWLKASSPNSGDVHRQPIPAIHNRGAHALVCMQPSHEGGPAQHQGPTIMDGCPHRGASRKVWR